MNKITLACLITATLALRAREAAACDPAPPPVCTPVLPSGSKVPRNLPGLFVKHQTVAATPTATPLAPPTEFFSVSGGAATLALSIVANAEQVSHPLYLARIVGGSTVDFGEPGARTVTVPKCNFSGEPITTGTAEEESSSYPITVTETAAFPLSVQPASATIRFHVAAKNNGANCGGPTEMVVGSLDLLLPVDVQPWLDVMQWQRADAVVSNATDGPRPLSPQTFLALDARPNDERTGIVIQGKYECGLRPAEWTIRGRIPGVESAKQPKETSFRVTFPDCASIPAGGSTEGPLDLVTGESKTNVPATTGTGAANPPITTGSNGCSVVGSSPASAIAPLLSALLAMAARRRRTAR